MQNKKLRSKAKVAPKVVFGVLTALMAALKCLVIICVMLIFCNKMPI